jgi:hypothetical protein
MSIRVQLRAEERLELSRGDYLVVKRDLNAGEYRELLRAATKPVSMTAATSAVPTLDLDPIEAGLSTVLAYLLDWSFQDPNGHPIVIKHQARNVVKAALDNIDSDSFMEIQRAIQEHQAARKAALEAEKKTDPGATLPDRTLTSVG